MRSHHVPPSALLTFLALSGAVGFFACMLDTQGQLDVSEQPEPDASVGGSAGEPGEGGAGPGGSAHGGAGGVSGEGGVAGSSGEGGAQQSGGSAGGGGSEQNCLDGTDDDGDSAIDCADTDCTAKGYACAALPSGWEGHFRLRVSDFAGAVDPLPCPGGAPAVRRFLDPATAAECSACTCSWGGATCGPPTLECSVSDKECKTLVPSSELDCGTCCNIKTDSFSDTPSISCYVGPLSTVTSPGSCTAGPPSDFANKDPWGRVLDICPVPSSSGGCPDGACLFPDTGDYDAGACIRHDGELDCPSGWTRKAVSFEAATDERSCSACGCGAADGVQCKGGAYKFHDTSSCEGCGMSICSDPVTVGASCRDLSGHADYHNFSAVIDQWPTASGGSCTPNGGEPLGLLTPSGAQTWCCKQL